MSRRHTWCFRLTAVVLAPILFLSLLEISLSVAGVGRPAAFFVPSDHDGVLITNHWFIRFYRHARTTSPHPCLIQAIKPDDSIRIFVFGGSAAMGTPDPSFGFARVLETMLQDHYPDRRVQVVNAAMRGINSHIVAPIAHQCAQLEPDLFIVYMGNNEVVGKHGPTSFLCHHPKLISPLQHVQKARFFQCVRTTAQRMAPADGGREQAQTMDVFHRSRVAFDDPRREGVYRNFQRNLARICNDGLAAEAGVVVTTVPVNLSEFPPLASLHREGLAPEQLERWHSFYDKAVEEENQHRWAVADYERAAAIDDHYADLHFRLARCLGALGDMDKAKDHFSLARDWDALQFRADSHINDIVRDVASGRPDGKVHLADLAKALTAHPQGPSDVPENPLFSDHVHHTFDGAYEVARRLLPTVVQALQDNRSLSPAQSAEVPSRDECARRLAFTAWDQADTLAGISRMLARPPFPDQIDHAARQAVLEQAVTETFKHMDQAFVEGVIRTYEKAIASNPIDWTLHYNYADFLYTLKRYRQATPHIRYVVDTFGDIATFRVLLGYCLAGTGRVDQGIEQFRKARQLDAHSKPVKDALAWALQTKQTLAARANQ